MRRMAVNNVLETDADEQALLDAWHRGDAQAMGAFYERYAPALRAYCSHRLGSPTDAEDAVHDTFLRAQQGLTGFRRGARVWPWLATIAAHVCTDMVRRRTRTFELDLPVAPVPEVDEQVAARRRAAIVGVALHELPPRYRVPLYLRHFAGSTYEEIARVQGKSVAAVRSVLMRGRRHLGHRIEALARSERQWPLPGVIPSAWQRLRVAARSGRVWVWRAEQALIAAVAPLGFVLNGIFGGGGATVANTPLAMALAVPVAAALAPYSQVPPTTAGHRAGIDFRLPLSEAVEGLAPVSLASTQATYTDIGTGPHDVPGTDGDITVEGHVNIWDEDRFLRMEAMVTVTTPLYGSHRTGSQKNIDCSSPLRAPACGPVREVLSQLPPEFGGDR